MNPESETSWVVSQEDAAVAVQSYDAVGYRVVGLEYDGAYSPKCEPDGTLIVDVLAVSSLRDCLKESILYNQSFRRRLIATNLRDRKIMPSEEHIGNIYKGIEAAETRISNYKRVRKMLKKLVAQEVEELAA